MGTKTEQKLRRKRKPLNTALLLMVTGLTWSKAHDTCARNRRHKSMPVSRLRFLSPVFRFRQGQMVKCQGRHEFALSSSFCLLCLCSRRQHTRNRHRNMRLCRPRDNWPVFNKTGLCWLFVITLFQTVRYFMLFLLFLSVQCNTPGGSKICPTGQSAISRELLEIFYQNFRIYI